MLRKLWGAPPFSPLQVPGIQLYLTAELASNVAEAASIGVWADASGNENKASQGTAGSRPTFRAIALNGSPSVLFDGVDDFMKADGVAASIAGTNTPYTLFVVSKLVDTAGSYDLVSFGKSSSATMVEHGSVAAGPVWKYNRIDDSLTAKSTTVGTPDTNPHVTSWQFDGTNANLWVDGVNIVNNFNQNLGAATFDQFTIGARRDSSTTNFLSGYISVILIYSGAISTDDRRKIEAFLGKKWGISVT